MDRGAWQATVYWVARVGHDLVTKHTSQRGGASLAAQTVKNLMLCGRAGFNPWVWKIPGEENGTHSSILAWRIPWTEEPGGLQSWGHKESLSNYHYLSKMDP